MSESSKKISDFWPVILSIVIVILVGAYSNCCLTIVIIGLGVVLYLRLNDVAPFGPARGTFYKRTGWGQKSASKIQGTDYSVKTKQGSGSVKRGGKKNKKKKKSKKKKG